jgi:hypothetical protein
MITDLEKSKTVFVRVGHVVMDTLQGNYYWKNIGNSTWKLKLFLYILKKPLIELTELSYSRFSKMVIFLNRLYKTSTVHIKQILSRLMQKTKKNQNGKQSTVESEKAANCRQYYP